MASSSNILRDREPDASADESPDSVRSDKSSRYSIDGVASQWDDEPQVRLRMRNSDHLLKHWDSKKGAETNDDVTRNVANLKLNYKVLSPLLKKMAENGHLLPVIDNIMEQVRNLLTRCKVQHDGERVYREGWAIKKLLSLAKSQMWKERNPKDPICRSILMDLGVNLEEVRSVVPIENQGNDHGPGGGDTTVEPPNSVEPVPVADRDSSNGVGPVSGDNGGSPYESSLQLVVDISDDESPLVRDPDWLRRELTLVMDQISTLTSQVSSEPTPADAQEPGLDPGEHPASTKPASERGDAVETQLQIPGDQFENTDYMQKQLQWMEEVESRVQKAEVPEIPEHSPITRRDQFQMRNSLKKEREDKKKARNEKEPAPKRKNKKGKPGSKEKKTKTNKSSPKSKAAPKPRGRPRKVAVVEDEGNPDSAKPTPSKSKTGKVSKATAKPDKRIAKCRRVAKAFRDRQATAVADPEESEVAEPSPSQAGPSKRRKVVEPQEPSAGTVSPDKTTKKNTNKGPAKTKETGKKAAPKSRAKKSKEADEEAAPKPRGNKSKKEPVHPCEELTSKITKILSECKGDWNQCENHSQDILALAENHDPSFQKSIYWNRTAVGLKVPLKMLAKDQRKNNSKKTLQQVCYCGGGPCNYANLAIMDAWVEKLKEHSQDPLRPLDPAMKHFKKIGMASRSAALKQLKL